MNGVTETKSEIRARINELETIRSHLSSADEEILSIFSYRLHELRDMLERAEEDLFSSVIRSHKVICKVKQMGEKDAYGNDPALYYTLAIGSECGEMGNKIIKAKRNGESQEKVLESIESELPDILIYSFVLAYVFDIDLLKLVNEKVEVVIDRANKGYYGGPLSRIPV
jgi:NTP pyrophosphatase (non-canonical NTP hydrolase)